MLLGILTSRKNQRYRRYDRAMRTQLHQHEWFYNQLYQSLPSQLQELTAHTDDVKEWSNRINHMNVDWTSQSECDYYYYFSYSSAARHYPLPPIYNLSYSLYYQRSIDFSPLTEITGIGIRHQMMVRRAFTDESENKRLFTIAIANEPDRIYELICRGFNIRRPMPRPVFRTLREWWLENSMSR